MVDICGELLNVGDLVSTRFDQLYRIGKIIRFTKTKVVVGFDYQLGKAKPEDLIEGRFDPCNLTKVINQNVGLADYLDFHKTFHNFK